jgi:hypothetical protein
VRKSYFIKTVIVLFILGAFAALSRNSITKTVPHDYKKNSLKEIALKKVSGSHKTESLRVKRLKKEKGTQALIPYIQPQNFTVSYNIKDYYIPKRENTLIPALFCTKLKRGPPAV